MKTFHEPIDVDLDDDGLPRSWRWRHRAWRVLRVLDRWVLQSRWWTGHGERRDYLLVEATRDDGETTGVAGGESRHATDARAAVADTAVDGPPPATDPRPTADTPPPCAVELYRRRPGLQVEGGHRHVEGEHRHEAWILARILT